jgi:Bacterial PH domain
MKETYRSKISLWLVITAGLLIAGILVLMLVQGAWPGVLIVAFFLAFVVHLYMNTYCTIDGNILQVRCGFIINTKIDIGTITKIVPTNSILSAPALPFNRIEVFYNRYDSIVISPGDNDAIIARLKEINEKINLG